MRIRLLISLALCFSVGCQANLPNSTKSRTTRPVAAADVQRLVSQSGLATEFSGKARILSDNGLGIISNNSGGIISDNGLGIISDNGLGVISNNAGSYRIEAAGAKQESFLADAKIEVLDAQGRILVDSAKKPIVATTDKKGAYKFKAVLPKENLVLRIRLWNGGTLFAMMVYDEAAGGSRTLDINTASTFGAQYVLDKFVQKRKEVYDRLPASEAEALQQAMEKARGLLTGKAPTYKPADTLKMAEDLRKQDTDLNTRLDAIEAILLAGQKNLGNGLPATQVSLGFPLGVVGDDRGRLIILESSAGRLRRVNEDGTAAVEPSEALGIARGIVRAPDGALIIACTFQNKVRRLGPDGKMTDIAGTGLEDSSTTVTDNPLTTSIVKPDVLAYGPDGTLYIGEANKYGDQKSRLFAISPDGKKLRQIDVEAVRMKRMEFAGLAVTKDGTLYVVDGTNGRLLRMRPGAAWETLVATLDPSEYIRLAVDNQDRVLVSETDNNRVSRLNDDGTLTPIAGNGTPEFTGDGGPATAAGLNQPAGLWVDKAGTIFIADAGNAVIRAVGTDGRIRTVAGVNGLTTQGDALTIAIGSPTAIAFDAQGRLVIAESGGNTIKRLENGKLSIIAGTSKGFGGDGGQATAAQLDTPLGLAYAKNGDLFFIDGSNYRLRKIDATGVISTLAGSGSRGYVTGTFVEAIGNVFSRPLSVVLDPQGQPVVADNGNHQIVRLNKDGKLELLAGSMDGSEGDAGDGGPASTSKIKIPASLAYDKAGNLYFCDTGNMRVRKIATDGTISTVAGMAADMTIAKLIGGAAEAGPVKATEGALLGPVGLCFDEAGNMYVSEAGTEQIASLGNLSNLGPLVAALPKVGSRIRKITPDGMMTTIAGPGTKVLADKDGDNSLSRPIGLLIDAQGRLVICDAGNNQIKMLPKGTF